MLARHLGKEEEAKNSLAILRKSDYSWLILFVFMHNS